VAITNVAVIDMESGDVTPRRTVLVRGSRIAGLFDAGAALPAGTRAVDGTGGFLIPGLWDMHTHSAAAAQRELPTFLAFGVTGIRNMHTSADTALQLVAAIRRQLAAGTITGPRFIANGAIVDGPRPAQPGSVAIPSPGAVDRIVDSLADGGADFVKVYNLLPRASYFALVAAAKRRGLAVVGHVPVTVRAEEAAAAGQRSIEHFDGLDFACSTREDTIRAEFLAAPSREAWYRRGAQLTASWSPDRCAAAIAAFARHGTWQVPTLAVAWAEAFGDSLLLDSSAMMQVAPEVGERWRAMAADTTHGPDPAAPERFVQANALVRLMRAARVPLLAGTDVGNPFVVPGWSLHHELALLVDAGLTPLEALQSATLDAARFLEATDSLGTVAPGKLADLVLLGANPLDDIRNSRTIRGVMINGRWFDRAALDALGR
jgi:imidazolonepropionase-like amidohydrolase